MTALAQDFWMPILSRLNAALLKSEDFEDDLIQGAKSSGWCGSPPVSESEILEAEQRLGIRLPPSYRSFLSVSNGWHAFSPFIYQLLPVQQIRRYRDADPDGAASILGWQEDDISDSDYQDYDNAAHKEALRPRYYPDSILVSEGWAGGELVLLNPAVVGTSGEWETIFFANWIPGNYRYRSFRDFAEYSVRFTEGREALKSK
jgi:hypothetical protein